MSYQVNIDDNLDLEEELEEYEKDTKFSTKIIKRVKDLPIFAFYKYMWKRRPRLLLASVFVNYILPILQEILPWCFNRRKVGNLLRDVRTSIQCNMVQGGKFSSLLLLQYLVLTALQIVLQTVERTLRNRVAVENRFIVRRMLLEKILYSDTRAMSKVPTQDLESRIAQDVHQTLNMFNYVIPGFFGALYGTYREALDLYGSAQGNIDRLMILKPIVTAALSKAGDLVKYLFHERMARRTLMRNSTAMSRLLTQVIEGLTEIQSNNLQSSQLHKLDSLVEVELDNSYGLKPALARSWQALSSRATVEFAAEVYVVHYVMSKYNVNHESYRKVQNDVDQVVRYARRTYAYAQMIGRVFTGQHRLIQVLGLPSFQYEHINAKYSCLPEFESLLVPAGVQFSYSASVLPSEPESQPSSSSSSAATTSAGAGAGAGVGAGAGDDEMEASSHRCGVARAMVSPHDLALDLTETMTFQRGKSYAVIGQNRSGKSTLMNILCKILQCGAGDIYYNGTIPYNDIPRVLLREKISYVSQKPYLFGGTIRDNILVGRTEATHDEVLEAARLAGVLMFGTQDIQRNQQQTSESRERVGHRRSGSAVSTSSSTATTANDSHICIYCAGSDASELETEHDSFYLMCARCRKSYKHPTGRKGNATAEEEQEEQEEQSAILPPRLTRRMKDVTSRAHVEHPVLDYPLQARGGNVSGGFGQSIALARVFLRREASVLILDEALGMMDAYKKREHILPNIFEFAERQHMTLILVTHDMTVARMTDHIYVLEKGRLQHSGSHAALVQASAPYYMKLLGE